MTGLEKILAHIQSDTDYTCDHIKKCADEKCADIINSANNKAHKIKTEGALKAKKVKEDILSRAESAAKLKKSSVLLSAKQEIIASSLEGTLKYLCELPPDEYFTLIYKMIVKYSEPYDGEIFFSSDDMQRMPENFCENILKTSNGRLTVSNTPVNIVGGFILKYSTVEINCAFESIFLSLRERFIDAISELFFAQRREL